MNTSQLECFTSLAQTLNYQKTADELGLTQPAVSKQIKALESEMGTTLFHRTTRMVSLTLAGSEFLPEAASMLRIYYQSLERSHKFHNTIHSVLRIGYLDPNILPLLSQVLSRVYKEHKNLRPELIQNQTDANLRLLLHNQLDCIVGMRDARFNERKDVRIEKVCNYSVQVPAASDQVKSIITRNSPFSASKFTVPPYFRTIT